MKKVHESHLDKLYSYQDYEYKEFNSKTIPNVDKDKIIGVRIPDIRKISKELSLEYKENYLDNCQFNYHEEYLLYGIILNDIKDIDRLLNYLDKLLVHTDNWQVTDIIKPKIMLKYSDKVLLKIQEWVNSKNEYMIRFGVVTLLNFYLDNNYNKKIFKIVNKIKYDSYYVNMAIAWFYSFAIIKHYSDAIVYIEKRKLSKWIHNKTISKCIDSYRINNDRKKYLKSLRWE